MRQDLTSLTITGHRGRALGNRLWQTRGDHLAVMFPGWSYGTDAPLLYYTRVALVAAGVSVLAIDDCYSEVEGFIDADDDEQERWFRADVEAVGQAIAASGPWPRLAIAGKSLGGQAALHLAGRPGFESAPVALLTPTLAYRPFRESLGRLEGRALFVVGSADVDHVEHVEHARRLGEVVVIDGADHGLDVAGDLEASLAAVGDAVRAVVDFLVG